MTLYENIAESLWQSCLNEDLGSAELYIQKLNEKALFGSMASSIKKWQKQIIQLTYMRINALEIRDGGTIYDIRPGMELTVPKGADYGIVSLKQGYVLDTTSGNIIKQPADYMQHVFDKPPKYLGSMSFGHEVMKLSDIKI